jgi:hypothetical protein
MPFNEVTPFLELGFKGGPLVFYIYRNALLNHLQAEIQPRNKKVGLL